MTFSIAFRGLNIRWLHPNPTSLYHTLEFLRRSDPVKREHEQEACRGDSDARYTFHSEKEDQYKSSQGDEDSDDG